MSRTFADLLPTPLAAESLASLAPGARSTPSCGKATSCKSR